MACQLRNVAADIRIEHPMPSKSKRSTNQSARQGRRTPSTQGRAAENNLEDVDKTPSEPPRDKTATKRRRRMMTTLHAEVPHACRPWVIREAIGPDDEKAIRQASLRARRRGLH